MVCGSAMVPGEKQVIEKIIVFAKYWSLSLFKEGSLAFYLPDLYVPQRASRTICQEFVDKCQSISYQTTTLAAQIMGINYKITPWEAYAHCG